MGSKERGQKAKNKKKNKDKPNSKLSAQDSNSNKNESGNGSGKIIIDTRFASVHSDPRFQKVPKHKTKVVIDSRFNRMFNDKRFAPSSAPFDKRGKSKKGNSQNSLRHYYHLEDEEGEKEEEKRKKEVVSEEGDSEEVDEETENEMLEKDSDGESEEEEEEGSESGSTTEEEDVDIIYEDGEPEVQEENITMIEKETRRLAVVNMDWRHVKAADLYVMLSSFLPKDGQIISVAVYPSEFGLQRMKDEEIHGPVGLFDDENDEDDDDEIDNEKLREYEKSRLRYYYAVVECDSTATADYLYKACDGVEFERSSTVLDLRFIPDTMEFKHSPRDVATEAPANYEGLSFHTQALQQSKIHLSWDEDEPQRGKILKRKFNAEQLAELELKEFLASDESESDDDDENEDAKEDQSDKKNKKRDKYLALLQSGDGPDGDGEDNGQDMEVTFNTGLEDISKRILEKKDKEAETVWEAYLRKRREKKKAKKNKSKYSSEDESDETDTEATEEPDDFFVEEPSVKRSKKEGKKHEEDKETEAEASRAELELLVADDKGADTGVKGFNLKPKKAKGTKGKEVLDEEKIPTIDDDPRFSALFTSPLYALDPTDPQFKRSATYARQIAKKLQKGEQQELAMEDLKTKNAQFPSDDPGTNKVEHEKSDILPSKEKNELSSMVRSVKMKLKQVQLPSKSKMSKKNVSGMGRNQEQHLIHSKKKSKVSIK